MSGDLHENPKNGDPICVTCAGHDVASLVAHANG